MGLVTGISKWLERWVSKLTMDLEGLPRLGFDPFSIDISYVLLEERRIVQLAAKSANATGYKYGLWGRANGRYALIRGHGVCSSDDSW